MTASDTLSPTTAAPDAPLPAALLASGDYAGALAAARAGLAGRPDDRDLGLAEASALRFLRREGEALAALDRLAARHPHFSLLHHERGLVHVARRDAGAAIAAFEQAVALNPALGQAWRMLAGVHRLAGDAAAAAAAEAQYRQLSSLPPPVVRATSLFADGDADAAEALIRQFLLTHGDHPEAMRLLARIGRAAGVLDDAELLYAGVLALVPGHGAARAEYAETLVARHKFAEAEAALAPLAAGDDPALRQLRASIAGGLGRHDEAIALYEGLLAELPAEGAEGAAAAAAAPRRAELNLWLGHARKTLGDLAGGIAAYRAATAARPGFGEAWWSLANLKTYRFTPDEITTMQAAAATAAGEDAVHLHFALGKALEDAGDPAASWHHYAQGNALQRAASQYRPEILETNTAEQIRVCTPAFFAARQGWGAADPAPIFVLGLPRSGSTLVEQILASHSQVEGTQELPDIQRLVIEMQGREPDYDAPRYPACLADLTRAEAQALGERYLAGAAVHRQAGRPLFIDKMPNNFRHIGLIHLILPQARIIDARRAPMDCCFSNLKQLFAQGQEFTYSATDIARYYRTYLELMRHWDRVLPGRVHRVINEDVIDDLEGEVRRLLAYCGLPFEAQCLAFHENRRAVRTPSSEQVRRPVNRDGQGQWRPFAPYLTELTNALGNAAHHWRD